MLSFYPICSQFVLINYVYSCSHVQKCSCRHLLGVYYGDFMESAHGAKAPVQYLQICSQ